MEVCKFYTKVCRLYSTQECVESPQCSFTRNIYIEDHSGLLILYSLMYHFAFMPATLISLHILSESPFGTPPVIDLPCCHTAPFFQCLLFFSTSWTQDIVSGRNQARHCSLCMPIITTSLQTIERLAKYL
jgi:hypothetical protein